MKKIPVNLVCGPLGIGKTTAIIDYLKRNASKQFCAVLVNDFGPVGLDAAIMEGDLGKTVSDRTAIKMLPGGCVCCTSAAGVLEALEELQSQPRLDRIIIEPSGLAMVGDMVDLVASVAAKFCLEIRPVITIIEPRLLDREAFTRAPYFVRMVEAADVLVANRCDLASTEQLSRFEGWTQTLYPPKLRVIKTTHGRLPDEVFEDGEARALEVGSGNGGKSTHAADQYAGGCVFDAGIVFDAEQIEQTLQELAMRGFVGNEILRLKAILRTTDGWRLYEIARGDNHCRPTDYRRDNRIDWITQGIPLLDTAVKGLFEKSIRRRD